FHPHEWIGKGHKYDLKKLPQSVVFARSAALEIPQGHIHHIPSRDLSVHDFLQLSLPAPSSTIVSVKVNCWFSHDPPDIDLSYLKTRPIPSECVLAEINSAISQAWLDGAQSLADPRYNDGRDRLPLWALTWWREFATTVRHQTAWRKCEEWLTKESKTAEAVILMMEARNLLAVLPWRADAGWRSSTLELTHLLGTDWISDELEDMMMAHLGRRARARFLHAWILIGSALLGQAVMGATSTHDKSSVKIPLLKRYHTQIVSLNYQKLFFPVHVQGNHWIAAGVDFDTKTISIGDSLKGKIPYPLDFVHRLQQWLRDAFGDPFTVDNVGLEHAMQNDTFSCGIVMANTIAHGALGDELWELKKRSSARAMWFITL
ncbi:hypothetical protein DFH29DRAFT_755847, partial [Suillus ampliporus]